MKNKLYTLSYFRKRLKEAEIKSVRLINEYEKDDPRYWTILIDPSNKKILLTCYKESAEEYYFSLITKTGSFIIKTLSMEIIIENIKMIKEKDNNDNT